MDLEYFSELSTTSFFLLFFFFFLIEISNFLRSQWDRLRWKRLSDAPVSCQVRFQSHLEKKRHEALCSVSMLLTSAFFLNVVGVFFFVVL